jgi:hypothetical protein
MAGRRLVVAMTLGVNACPVGWPLYLGKNGSRGRARTYNHTVNSRVLYH